MARGFVNRLIGVLRRLLGLRQEPRSQNKTPQQSGRSAPAKLDAEHPDSIYPLW